VGRTRTSGVGGDAVDQNIRGELVELTLIPWLIKRHEGRAIIKVKNRQGEGTIAPQKERWISTRESSFKEIL
jgi:hypothetical protein